MADTKSAKNKKNISAEKVRLPDEVMKGIRKLQARYLAQGGKAPSQGALLLEAWRTYIPPKVSEMEGILDSMRFDPAWVPLSTNATPDSTPVPDQKETRKTKITNAYASAILDGVESLHEAKRMPEIEALVTLVGALAGGSVSGKSRKDQKGNADSDSLRAALALIQAARRGSKSAIRALKDAGFDYADPGSDKEDSDRDERGA